MNAFDLMADQKDRHKIPCVLIGGFALHFYGVDRQTLDVDFLVPKEAVSLLSAGMGAGGYRLVQETGLFARWQTDQAPRLDIDFLFVDAHTLDAIVREAKPVDIGGREFLVPSLNHLIALKLHAIKQDPRNRGMKDMVDILRLAEANGVDVRSEDFKARCLTFADAGVYDALLHFTVR